MGNVVELSVARKKRKNEQRAELYHGYFEEIYQRPLTPSEKKFISGLFEDEQIDELIYRCRIANETNLVPWASDEEVEAWTQKYFYKKRDE